MARRLPGLRFEALAPRPDVVLPRMDIAAFIGFAARGPLDIPVAIEDVSQFAEIFGPDAPLAWDRRRGAMVYAFLAPAVRAFFRGGGRRCWVIRVAGAGAHTARFTLTGLNTHTGPDISGPPAQLLARSPGSWADDLRVLATLERRALPETLLDDPAGSPPFGVWAVDVGDDLGLGPRAAQLGLAQGDLVRITADGRMLWCVVARGGDALRVAVIEDLADLFSPPARPAFELLTCALWVWDGSATPLRLGGLGFAPDHPRYLGALPDDLALFGPDRVLPTPGAPDRGALWREVASPRFPLAGMGGDALLLPSGLTTLPDRAGAAPPETDRRTTLERDGLSDFGAALFLDPGMNDTTVFSLAAQAEWLRYQQPNPRRLSGIHAAYELEEVSLIAVPDALHVGWKRYTPPEPEELRPSVAPDRPAWWPFLACAAPDSPLLDVEVRSTGAVLLSWHAAAIEPAWAIEEARLSLYELVGGDKAAIEPAWAIEEARRPDFADAEIVWRGDTMHTRLPNRAAGDYFYRVRAERESGPGPWSNAVVAQVPDSTQTLPRYEHFLPCDLRVLATPELRLTSEPDDNGTLALSWNPLPEAGTRYIVEEAARPDWIGAHTISETAGTTLTIYGRPAGVYYYRVRAVLEDATSDWSNGVVVQVQPPPAWALLPPPRDRAEREERLVTLLAVQRALLRMCAARGDTFALLALPEAARADEALAAAALLAGTTGEGFETRIAPLSLAEEIAFSYGALYHPWPVARDERGPEQLRALPPDGVMCGLYARQALERGAWIAPANQPLPGVVALTPAVPENRRGDLLEAQINQIRQEARGFLNLSADTLSRDELLRPVNVRRLLILLRRLAIRKGAGYVFEANNDAFRRLVKREFESTLGYLFTRGAFVGGTPATSFRVDVSGAPGDLDAGRLIVELRVAPAQPLAFLTVRLVQIGDRARVLEVR